MTMTTAAAERPSAGVVLLVDDTPDALRMLCDALQGSGYTVLVATSGDEALERLELVVPDAVLLDAVMPGLDGFAVCRRLRDEPAWAHVPVIFMTGLAETEHLVKGFSCGAVDYVTKPVRVPELLARLSTHVRNARVTRLARTAADVGGLGVVMVDDIGRIAWQSPQARDWLARCQGCRLAEPVSEAGWSLPGGERLCAHRLGQAGLGETMWLLSLEVPSGPVMPDRPLDSAGRRLRDAALTPRETEVLAWLAKGKTNRDIGEILGMSPRTVNKHLEHVFEKLGVETRAAAAALASRFAESTRSMGAGNSSHG